MWVFWSIYPINQLIYIVIHKLYLDQFWYWSPVKAPFYWLFFEWLLSTLNWEKIGAGQRLFNRSNDRPIEIQGQLNLVLGAIDQMIKSTFLEIMLSKIDFISLKKFESLKQNESEFSFSTDRILWGFFWSCGWW